MDRDALDVVTDHGTPQEPTSGGLFRFARNLALAGIGVVDVVFDGPQALYQRSIERGEDTVHRLWERVPRGRQLRSIPSRLTSRGEYSGQASDPIAAALARLNVPTAADIDTLTQQVVGLEAKINQLDTP